MVDVNEIKQQRDRFLAFSFASADLFFEAGDDGNIIFALGAARSLTGIDHESLIGQNWLSIFSKADRMALTTMRNKASAGQRCGPLSVKMDAALGNGEDAILTAILMPGSDNLFVTIGFPSLIMQKIASTMEKQVEAKELLDKESFLYVAQEAFDIARSLGQGLEMTLLDIADAAAIKNKVTADAWNNFTDAVTGLLGSHSFDGQTVACVADGRYSFIHDGSIDPDTIRDELYNLSRETDPDGEGFEITSKNVSADLQSLSERETMKALVYTINEFERKGTDLNIQSLNAGFKAYVSANVQKIQEFKSMVEQLAFDFEFHPIVNLETNNVSHFEMLTRFRGGGSTREWVIFAEDIGMAADFDIAVCERAINYLLYKSAGHASRFAVNLSGQSMQNEQFFKTLLAKLTLNKDLANRMIFEITESSAIEELEMVNHFIKTLQKNGFKICLDDFGAANSASLQHIQQLHVDYVKIEGQYTQKILKSDRDAVLVKNISKMCHDLNIQVIAERIEFKEQAEALRNIGVPLGQGFYFARPQKKPVFELENIEAA